MKKYLIFPILSLFIALAGCETTDDEAMTIELASPKLKVTTELATATVTWDAIAKTAGYAYALDQSTEYVQLAADVTSVTLTQLAKGSHTFRIKAVGNLEHTTDSAERTIDFEIDPTLETPKPSYVKGEAMGSVTISWEEVKGAAGYAYKLDDDASWTNVGADVLSIVKEGLDVEQTHTFTMYAVGQLPDSSDSEEASLSFKLVDTSEGVWIRMDNGELYETTESETGIFTATIPCKASDSFDVLIQNATYGFTSYSGNGGVGTVNNTQACVPFYNYPTATYYVRQSLGQMTAKVDDSPINKFWINMDAACEINVRIDCTQETPRYKLQLVEAEDPSLVLAQYFDLMVLGGDWIQTGKLAQSGRKASATDTALLDGTEAGTTDAKYTDFGANIASDASASPEYLANRDLTGWGIAYCFEFPGYVRLSNTASSSSGTLYYGILTTPKLAALTSASTITLTFDAVRFASEDNIPVKVLGAGTIAAANVQIEGSSSQTAITPESDGKSIEITSAHCPKHGNEELKVWSNFTVTIEGATAETQISWDATGVGETSKDGRICVDNIVIRKN